ncbi:MULTISPECIES: hypothetical protein [unclassified Rhizobium]|uniref:hypothetical protein n=1 Tax=unclassified Rhizobium TaxID=2613769 RepID=UPI0007EBFFE1|nr:MULTISPECIES: hypothetical protein [unclassified Rhizobium]ANL12011.1 hypothetical protein AMJ98_PA00065 [Rhizobium sp. N1341]ANM42856.1 hypothetical protein AMK03_PA00065 [Rhizobium sp. N741]
MMDTSALKSKYPRLVDDPYFECKEGWAGLLDDFLSVVDRVLPADREFRLLQVKEKMGGLRIYYSAVPSEAAEEIRNAERRAEMRSEHICETCGKRGRMSNSDGYWFVACEEHLVDDKGRAAVPSEGFTRYGTPSGGWQRYDFDLDALVPCDPPEGY